MNQYTVAIISPDGQQAHVQMVYEGMTHVFSIVSPFLVSAGQMVDLGICVRFADWVKPTEPGDKLLEANPCLKSFVTLSGWALFRFSVVPSRRTLGEILADAVQHGRDNPRHGADCICMDDLVRELRAHIRQATPQWNVPYEELSPEDRKERLDSQTRVGSILHRLSRNW